MCLCVHLLLSGLVSSKFEFLCSFSLQRRNLTQHIRAKHEGNLRFICQLPLPPLKPNHQSNNNIQNISNNSINNNTKKRSASLWESAGDAEPSLTSVHISHDNNNNISTLGSSAPASSNISNNAATTFSAASVAAFLENKSSSGSTEGKGDL